MTRRTVMAVCVLSLGLGATLAIGMVPADDRDLAAASGMDTVGACKEKCCAHQVGATCTYTPPPGLKATAAKECLAYLEYNLETGESWCARSRENDPCYYINIGPSKHDGCPTGNPTDTCTLHKDGWCIEYQTGKCKTKYRLFGTMRAGCQCEDLGAPDNTGTRSFCNSPESVMCQ